MERQKAKKALLTIISYIYLRMGYHLKEGDKQEIARSQKETSTGMQEGSDIWLYDNE